MNNTNKGGYQILDLGNVDLTTSPTIEGLYELIEGTKKPIRLTRINLGGVEKHDVVSMPVVSGSDYVFENVYGYDLSIDSDGNLSLASTKWATKAEIEAGTLDNAKPIYIHPILVQSIEGDVQYSLSLFVFDNDSTPYTLSTFKALIDNLFTQLGETVRFPCSGFYLNTSKHITSVSCLAKVSENNYILVGGDANGHAYITTAWSTMFGTPSEFQDGVNKIN